MDFSVQKLLLPILCNNVVNNSDVNRQESAMNLLISVVKSASSETCKSIFENLSQVFLQQNFFENSSDEFCSSVIILLSHLIGKIGKEFLNIQNNNIVIQLFNIVDYLLRQDVSEEKCGGVGKLIFLMLKYMEEKTLTNFAESLIRNVVLKLGNISTTNFLLKEELLIIICKMLQVDFNATLKIISNISKQATEFIFEVLTKIVLDCVSKFHLNVFSTTLIQILMMDRQIIDQIRINVQFENFSSSGVQTRSKRAENLQNNKQSTENFPLSVAATISLIRLFSQMSQDLEEDWDDSCDEENDKENIDVFSANNKNYYKNNTDNVDNNVNSEKILDVSAFDPSIDQDPIYSMNLQNYLGDFFNKCVQEQNDPFKMALAKCPLEQQRIVFGMQQTEQ
eukprot:TRINITY_DN845_c1_g1_i1.p1 TRINITY_DN845_c1_g1~~TRINITY_DN845_c1_g1_i1.p1  ORF type:complete len:395 (-),score=76.85 TRINITY_DN845_c1_g1_i1:1203-2387(-)